MQRLLAGVALGIVLTTALLVAVTAVAQDADPLKFGRPLAVDLRQSVPVLAEIVVPLGDNTAVTATVPLTLDIALQVAVSGAVSPSLQVAGPAAVVAVAPSAPATAPRNAQINQTQPLIYDNLQWQVKSAENVGKVFDDPHDRQGAMMTENSFLAVHLAVENLSFTSQEVDYDDDELTILVRDSAGRRFAWQEHPSSCDEHELNPGLVKSCTLIFEVPPNAQGFSVIFAAEHGYEQAVPLGF